MTLVRLDNSALQVLPDQVERPSYDRSAMTIGVVHFGPGAFHRAHQAAAFDSVLELDRRWAICGVSLSSINVADALRPQQGLYTLATLDHDSRMRVIGAIGELLTAADAPAILERLVATNTRLVTATVTEKGYTLDGEGKLDWNHPAIVHDLSPGAVPTSLVGWLVAGLHERRFRGGEGLTVLSCDNLSDNGRKLGQAVRDFAARKDPDTARWIQEHVRFPSSMVDSITPATDDALRARVAATLRLEDAWPVQRERFTQWVIEDDFADDRPPLEAAGVIFTPDVQAFETAKLRLLNGAHSSLAYIGMLLGHGNVAQAMADSQLAAFVEQMMREDIAPSVAAADGLVMDAYITKILERFANPAVDHRLAQIAGDGSQKLPYRLLDTIRAARVARRPITRLAIPIAAWLRHVERASSGQIELIDPLRDSLLKQGREPLAILDQRPIFGTLSDDEWFRAEVASAFGHLGNARELTGLLT